MYIGEPFSWKPAAFEGSYVQGLIVKVYCTPAQQMSMETTCARRKKMPLR